MNEAITILVLVEGVILGWHSARRLGLLSPATVYIGFITIDFAIFAEIFWGRLDKSNFTFTAMPWPDFSAAYPQVVWLSALLILLGWLATLGLKRQAKTPMPDFFQQIWQMFPRLRQYVSLLLFLLALFVFGMEIFHLWDIDLNILWKNQTYLTINNPVSAGLDTLPGRLIHLALRPLGLLLVAISVFLFVNRRRDWGILFLLLSIYPFLIALAQNSRWAPLYVFSAGLIFLFFGGIKRYFLPILLSGILGFIAFLKVLVGRNTPFQGLSGISDTLSLVFVQFDVQLRRWALGFFLNIFQGAQNIANAFLIHPTYPERYKLLSFSPTISAIDHFDKIVGTYLIKIAPVVPMNTYAEAYFFGAFYFLFLCLILTVWLRAMTQLFLRKDLIGTAFAIFSYWVTFYISQYPVRNSMRFIYFSLLIGMIINSTLAIRKTRTDNLAQEGNEI